MKRLLLTTILILLSAPLAAQPYHSGALRLGITGGINVGGEEATAKYAEYSVHPYGTLTLERYMLRNIAVTASLFAGTLSADITGRAQFPAYGDQLITGYNAKYYGLSGGLNFVLPKLLEMTPVLRPRIGFLVHQTRVDGDRGFEERLSRAAVTYGIGGGFEFPVAPTVAFTFGYDLVLTNSDEIDGLVSGTHNDALSVFTAGINVLIMPGEDPARPLRRRDDRFSTLQPTALPTAERLQRPATSGDGQAEPGRERTAGETGQKEADPGYDDTPAMRPLSGGDEQQQLRGLSLPTAPAIPEDQLHPVERGGSLRLFTELSVTPITRLVDLKDNPGLFLLRAVQTGGERMQLKCYVEFLRDGVAFYQGNADLLLRGREAEFEADAFIDLSTLVNRNDGRAPLPRGNYQLRISTVAWDQDLSSLSKAKFLNADLRPIFGPKEAEARVVITEGAVDISLEGSEELVVNFFRAREDAVERLMREKKSPEAMRAALPLVQVSMTGTPREQYLAGHVEKSLNEGLKLQSIAGSIGRAQHLKHVLAEVFFPIDSDLLGEESRIVLDNAARLLNQHPELFAEIRGYASDIGDESYNRMLAGRRAQRVLEYLVRQKLNAYRVSVGSGMREKPSEVAGEDARMGRRVEIVLKNRGM